MVTIIDILEITPVDKYCIEFGIVPRYDIDYDPEYPRTEANLNKEEVFNLITKLIKLYGEMIQD